MPFQLQDLRAGKVDVTRQELVQEYIKTRCDPCHEFCGNADKERYLELVYALGVFMFGEIFIEEWSDAVANLGQIYP